MGKKFEALGVVLSGRNMEAMEFIASNQVGGTLKPTKRDTPIMVLAHGLGCNGSAARVTLEQLVAKKLLTPSEEWEHSLSELGEHFMLELEFEGTFERGKHQSAEERRNRQGSTPIAARMTARPLRGSVSPNAGTICSIP